MKTKGPIFLIGLLLTAGIGWCSEGFAQVVKPATDPTEMLRECVDSRLSRIEILYFPTNVLTRTQMSGSQLEKNFHYKLIFSNITSSGKAKQLRDIISKAKVVSATVDSDIRWGCLFYDETGRRLGSVFLDGISNSGMINAVKVSMDPALRGWLETNVSDCFR